MKITELLPYIQSVGIILSFLITAYTTWRSVRVSRVTTYLDLVKSHRDIWSLPIKEDGLDEIFSNQPKDWSRKITAKENSFVGFAINHLSCSFELMKAGNVIKPQGLKTDMRAFFSIPVPRRIWEETKHLRNDDFCRFVDSSLAGIPVNLHIASTQQLGGNEDCSYMKIEKSHQTVSQRASGTL